MNLIYWLTSSAWKTLGFKGCSFLNVECAWFARVVDVVNRPLANSIVRVGSKTGVAGGLTFVVLKHVGADALGARLVRVGSIIKAFLAVLVSDCICARCRVTVAKPFLAYSGIPDIGGQGRAQFVACTAACGLSNAGVALENMGTRNTTGTLRNQWSKAARACTIAGCTRRCCQKRAD